MSSERRRAVLQRRYEEPIPPAELARRRAIPVSDAEVAELMALVRWFRRRYPTARERFAYVRRKHAEWNHPRPASPKAGRP